MKYVSEENYVAIQGWMRSVLGLKGTDLIIYAIIYGFSQQDGHWFNGSLQYLAEWAGVSKQSCITSLKKLVDKELIKKEEVFENGLKYCKYSKNFTTSQKSLIPVKNFEYQTSQKSLINNINNINIIKGNNTSNHLVESNNPKNNIDIVKEKKLTKKQLKEKQEQEENEKINNLIDQYTDDPAIQDLLERYVLVRKQKGMLTSAQFYIMLEDLRNECGQNKDYTKNCIRQAIAGGWSQIVFIDKFKGSFKTSYGTKSVDNTANHFTGNEKITDEEFSNMSFEDKKHYIGTMAVADMTPLQKEFFDEYCLARDENGNLLKF